MKQTTLFKICCLILILLNAAPTYTQNCSISIEPAIDADMLCNGPIELTAYGDGYCSSSSYQIEGSNICSGFADTDPTYNGCQAIVQLIDQNWTDIRYYSNVSVTFVQDTDNGTATLSGVIADCATGSLHNLVANYGGFTTAIPVGSPKEDYCCITGVQDDWFFYTTLTGTITSQSGNYSMSFVRKGPAAQFGTNANIVECNTLGSSAWFTPSAPYFQSGDIFFNYTIEEDECCSNYFWDDGTSAQTNLIESPGFYCVSYLDCNGCYAEECFVVEGCYDCLGLQANYFDPCDDGNPITTNDVVQIDCNCLGEAPYIADYCEVTGNNFNVWIHEVIFGDINNLSGPNYGYADYNHLSTSCDTGESYPIELLSDIAPNSADGKKYWKVWIDFNRDGDFDDTGETVLQEVSDDHLINGGITIPQNATEGYCRMRIAMAWTFYAPSCGAFPYGEVEDYTILINEITPSCAVGQPCDDGNPCTIGETYNTNCDCVGLIIQDCGTEQIISAPNYCESNGANSNYEYIQSIKIGSINNDSGNDNGYGNFTDQSTICNRNMEYDITLTPGFTGNPYNENWNVWIDFNQDGDFGDEGEKVGEGRGSTALNLSFTIPSTATIGNTRMRVAMQWALGASSCGTLSYGEVEDYTINIVSLREEETFSLSFRESAPSNSMQVYPNPVATTLYVNIENTPDNPAVQLEVYDVKGSLLSSKSLNTTRSKVLEIDTNHLDEGIYMLVMRLSDGQSIAERFIKTNE